MPKVDTRISNLPSRLNDWVIKRTFSMVESLSLFEKQNQIKIWNFTRKTLLIIAYLISISFDLMSPIEFPMNDICSSLTPDSDTLIHLNMGTDDSSACKNCGSTRCFLFLSKTDMPSILMWLIVDDFNAFEMALNVLAASSRWIIQLQIFRVLRSLRKREEKVF